MDRLYRIFNELGIPCFMLFDYDKDSDKPEMIKKSRELLQMLGESPDVSEGVLIKDRVACFSSKWEVSLAAEIPNYGKLCEEARSAMALREDSGKPLVARYVARCITSQDPPFVPESVKNIIEKAVNVEWAQSCLAC